MYNSIVKEDNFKEEEEDDRNIAAAGEGASGSIKPDGIVNSEPMIRHNFPETWMWLDFICRYIADYVNHIVELTRILKNLLRLFVDKKKTKNPQICLGLTD